MDLEHWASFRKSFDDVTDLLTELVPARIRRRRS